MTMKEYYGIHKVARFATKKEMKDMSEWMYEYKGCMVMLAEYTPCGKKTCWVASVWEETGNKRFPYNKLFEMASYPHFTAYGLKLCRQWRRNASTAWKHKHTPTANAAQKGGVFSWANH